MTLSYLCKITLIFGEHLTIILSRKFESFRSWSSLSWIWCKSCRYFELISFSRAFWISGSTDWEDCSRLREFRMAWSLSIFIQIQYCSDQFCKEELIAWNLKVVFTISISIIDFNIRDATIDIYDETDSKAELFQTLWITDCDSDATYNTFNSVLNTSQCNPSNLWSIGINLTALDRHVVFGMPAMPFLCRGI